MKNLLCTLDLHDWEFGVRSSIHFERMEKHCRCCDVKKYKTHVDGQPAWVRFDDRAEKRRDRIKRQRMRFIMNVHHYFPRLFCWADCVSWAGTRTDWKIWAIERSTACKQESIEELGACYCGGWEEGKHCSQMTEEDIANRTAEIIEVAEELPF